MSKVEKMFWRYYVVDNKISHISNNLLNQIKEFIFETKVNIEKQINTTMITTYWNVGRIIVEFEQNGSIKAEYGKQLVTYSPTCRGGSFLGSTN
jgi:hypothetical protein